MNNDIKMIQEYLAKGNSVIFTSHIYQQIKKRHLHIAHIYHVLKSNEATIIQCNKKEKVLVISGYAFQKKYHVVLRQKGNLYVGISIYKPSKKVFDENDKLLKHKKNYIEEQRTATFD